MGLSTDSLNMRRSVGVIPSSGAGVYTISDEPEGWCTPGSQVGTPPERGSRADCEAMQAAGEAVTSSAFT